MKKFITIALISVVSLAGITGCAGSSPSSAGNDGFGLLNTTETGTEHFGKMHKNFLKEFLKELNLTDGQKVQFKELQNSMPKHDKGARGEDFKTALKEAFLSPSINKADLKAKLESLRPQNDDHLNLMAANLIKAYNILTPEQRSKVENKLNDMEKKMTGFMNNPIAQAFHGGPEKHLEKMTANLNLNDSQKAALKSLMQDGMPDRKAMLQKAGTVKTAVLAELKSGSPSADKLKNIFQGIKAEMQPKLDSKLDKMVQVHALLTPEQRQKLVANLESGHKKFKGKGQSWFHH